jgi:hypothetical protein
MWAVWITTSAAVLIALAVLLCLRATFRAAPIGWRLLSASGIPLSIAGLIFIIRFWQPIAGPYRANELYPYGNHLHAWAVSFGFTWLAFGLLFAGMALLGSRSTSRVVWVTLLASWFICWLPHGMIGASRVLCVACRRADTASSFWSEHAGFHDDRHRNPAPLS